MEGNHMTDKERDTVPIVGMGTDGPETVHLVRPDWVNPDGTVNVGKLKAMGWTMIPKRKRGDLTVMVAPPHKETT